MVYVCLVKYIRGTVLAVCLTFALMHPTNGTMTMSLEVTNFPMGEIIFIKQLAMVFSEGISKQLGMFMVILLIIGKGEMFMMNLQTLVTRNE